MESNPEIERNIVVTSNTIDEIRYTVNYKCEKCGRSESASLYVQ
ncbi:MAG: hypothetical protein U9P44_03805 [archaeon]|nr:hypothetical protein [archaeon]